VSTSATTGAGGGGEAIAWQPCPLELGGTENDAECATVELPVRWDRPDGDTIGVFVQRYLARIEPAYRQLWMLQGGPGAAGDGYAPIVRALAESDPSIDFYIPDHRGTGRSARLGCPVEEAPESPEGTTITDAEWPSCQEAVQTEWGDGLEGFSSMGASHDVAALIERTREEKKIVALYGASYGTTWGHRFLQLYPDTVDAVVLDSTNWPDRSYEDYDFLWDSVAHSLFNVCGVDAFCSSKLGPDPWNELAMLYADLETGHCPELTGVGLTKTLLGQVLAWMTAYGALRPAALATVYRVRRCDPADQTAVVTAINALFGPGGLLAFDDALFSAVLSRHVLRSEIGREPVSAEAVAFASNCLVCIGAGSVPFDASWPRYPFDAAFQTWAETDTPLLIMNGSLDPFAPYFRLDQAGAADHFTAPTQHVVQMTLAPHGSLFGSPSLDGTPCGLTLMLDFISNPTGNLDDACLTKFAAIDFTGDAVAPLFGTTDAWD